MSYPTQMPPMPQPTEQEAREMAAYYGEETSCTWCGEPTNSPQHEVCRECAYMMEDHDHVE